MSQDPLIGKQLAGRFKVVDELGEGSMAQVYLAEHEVLGREYAIKVLRRNLQTRANFVERFRREARAASRLDHPNIVSITDFGRTDDGRFYIVMEYAPGQSLRDLMEDAEPDLLPLPRVLDLLLQTGNAVAAAHDAGVIHRDLKPENLLLVPRRTGGEQVKVLDFGFAKIVADPSLPPLTKKGEIFGTADYMSPEQAQGEPADHRADIYTFGVIAFELVSGQVPFQCRTLSEILIAHLQAKPPLPSTLRPAGETPIPTELETTILSCLQKKREQRPANMKQVNRVVESCLERILASAPDSTSSYAVAAPDGDQIAKVWPEAVTVEAQAAGVSPEAAGQHLIPTHPTLAQKESVASKRAWLWNQISKNARNLAHAMRDMRLGTVELTQVLGSLGDIEDRVLACETEIALMEARQNELDSIAREREARLRYAVVDLSMERGRLLEEGAGPQIITDLDFQINELEKRLAAVFREKEQQQAQLETEAASKRSMATGLYQNQRAAEMRLLRLLRETKPPNLPTRLAQSFDELERLLRAWT